MEKIVNKAFQLLQSARRNGVFISVDDNQLSIKYSKENNIEPHLLEEIKNPLSLQWKKLFPLKGLPFGLLT